MNLSLKLTSLDEDQTAKVQQVLSWDCRSLINRVHIEHRLPIEEAKLRVEQYLAFMALMLIFPENRVHPPHKIDEVWHSAILNTGDYHRFCEEIFGEFVHHILIFDNSNAAYDNLVMDTTALAEECFDGLSAEIWNGLEDQKFVCTSASDAASC